MMKNVNDLTNYVNNIPIITSILNRLQRNKIEKDEISDVGTVLKSLLSPLFLYFKEEEKEINQTINQKQIILKTLSTWDYYNKIIDTQLQKINNHSDLGLIIKEIQDFTFYKEEEYIYIIINKTDNTNINFRISYLSHDDLMKLKEFIKIQISQKSRKIFL